MVNAGYVHSGYAGKVIKPSMLKVTNDSILGPLLINVYLHEFDCFMESLQKNSGPADVVSQIYYVRHSED